MVGRLGLNTSWLQNLVEVCLSFLSRKFGDVPSFLVGVGRGEIPDKRRGVCV